MTPDAINRTCAIVTSCAAKMGIKAAVYTNAKSFDVLTEGPRGIYWVRRDTAEVFYSPASTAFSIRREMKEVWQ